VSERVLERTQRVELGRERTFELFADAFNLETLTPPLLRFRVVTPAPIELRAGTLIEYRLRLHGVPVRWLTRIEVWEPPRRFVDGQVRGPYELWHHTHEFEPDGDGTLIRDRVRYRIGFGPLGELAQRAFVGRDLERILDYRREAIGRLITASSRNPSDRTCASPLDVKERGLRPGPRRIPRRNDADLHHAHPPDLGRSEDDQGQPRTGA
jgi:ligand-binding SRPBCC domain-containing protein